MINNRTAKFAFIKEIKTASIGLFFPIILVQRVLDMRILGKNRLQIFIL